MRLTEDLRSLAAEAFALASPAARDCPGAVGLRIVRRIGRYDAGRSGLGAWARCHARFARRDEARRLRPWEPLGGRDIAREDDGPARVDAIDEAEAVLRRLTPTERAVVVARVMDEDTIEAVAARLGLSGRHVSRIQRGALRRVRGAGV